MTDFGRAMVLDGPGRPLRLERRPRPLPGPGQLLLAVTVCGVCRTDLHVRDGDLADPHLPLVLGHEVVAVVRGLGPGAGRVPLGTRVGVPWLGWTCGVCPRCRAGRENLCVSARFTGYTVDGGFAEWMVADERFVLPLPAELGDSEAAPLLCAGLIGYRAWRLAGEAARIGLYGFGASAHLIAQVARHHGQAVLAFTRPGDLAGQAFARECGAEWAGASDEAPPEPLDAAIIFAPAGELVPRALAAVAPGGTVVCAGIHMSDIPRFPYRLLWGERTVRSVANLTRRDGEELLALAPRIPVRVHTTDIDLVAADHALGRLRAGVEGALVLRVGTDPGAG